MLDCLWYEYARESLTIIDAVKTWRKWRRLSSTARNEQRVFPGRQLVLSARLRILTLCPEFPGKAWLEIPISERDARIKRFRLSPVQIMYNNHQQAFNILDPLAHQQRLLALVPKATLRKEVPDFDLKVHGGCEDFFCEINWERTSGEIIESFRRWVTLVKQKRSEHRRNPKSDRTQTALRVLLKALGAFRLLRHFLKNPPAKEHAIGLAIEYTQSVMDKPLYADRESWFRVVRRARQFGEQECGWLVREEEQ